MKKLALAAALSVVASTSFAGSAGPAMTEPEVEMDTSSSAGGILVPMLALLLIAAAVSSD